MSEAERSRRPFEIPEHPGRRWGWVFAAVWLFYLLDPVTDLFHQRHSLAVRVFGVAVTVVFGLVYVQCIRRGFVRMNGGSIGRWWMLSFGLIAVTVLMAFVVGESSSTYAVFAMTASIMLWPVVASVSLVLVTTVWTAYLLPWILGEGPVVELAVISLAVALLMFAMRWMQRQESVIRRARRDMATMAVDAERARFSRDLHDIVGHSLTAIIVKAELARALADRRPEGVGPEVADIEQLARGALEDVRRTVAGYREVTLAGELASARAVLDAAGIQAVLPQAVDEVPGKLRELFGWVVREGVTNVVRHSRAQTCRVLVTSSSVEVVDDGQGGKPDGGNGLAGLRERVHESGGELRAGPADDGGFRLAVTVTESATTRAGVTA